MPRQRGVGRAALPGAWGALPQRPFEQFSVTVARSGCGIGRTPLGPGTQPEAHIVRLTQPFGTKNQPLAAGLGDVAEFDVAGLDVLHLDIENTGASALTDFRVFARVAPGAPWRDVTPGSLTVEGDLVFAPARTSLTTLAAANWAHLGLNVTDYQSIKLQAAGASAELKVTAGGYEVKS